MLAEADMGPRHLHDLMSAQAGIENRANEAGSEPTGREPWHGRVVGSGELVKRGNPFFQELGQTPTQRRDIAGDGDAALGQ